MFARHTWKQPLPYPLFRKAIGIKDYSWVSMGFFLQILQPEWNFQK